MHFEYSGNKIMMIGPIVCQVCGRRKSERNNETRNILDDEFHQKFHTSICFFLLQVNYLSSVFMSHLVSFGDKYHQKASFSQLKSSICKLRSAI